MFNVLAQHLIMFFEKKSLIFSGPRSSTPFVKPAARFQARSTATTNWAAWCSLLGRTIQQVHRLDQAYYWVLYHFAAQPAFQNSNPCRCSEPANPKDPSPPRVFKCRVLSSAIAFSLLFRILLLSPLPADRPDSSALGPMGRGSARFKGVGGRASLLEPSMMYTLCSITTPPNSNAHIFA